MIKNLKSNIANFLEFATVEEPFKILYDLTNEDFEIIDDHMDKKFNQDDDEGLR
jgi:hypothetical protein